MPKISKANENRKRRAQCMAHMRQRKRESLHSIDENQQNSEPAPVDICSANEAHKKKTLQNNEAVSIVHKENAQREHTQEIAHEVLISTEKEQTVDVQYVGRRVINVAYFTKQLLDFTQHHGPLECPASGIILTGEKQNGLMSKFTFKCKMCNTSHLVNSDSCDDDYLNLNLCAVAGTVATGCGQAQLVELMSAMNLPSLSDHLYKTNHQLVSKHWERVATDNMIKAGEKEKEIALAEGKVTKDGYGVVDVIADGCWSKRSYKKNYNALSGAAAIIGKNTGQILFLGVKNKYCQVCSQCEKEKMKTKDHLCFKNYEGPSTGMESQILVEGFKSSIEQHGLIYGKLISDGDSSTYSKIIEARPYTNTTVEKIECRNHVLRNFCNKLQALTTETKFVLKHRKCVTKTAILSMRGAIIKCIQKHKTNSDMQLLFEDILHCHRHAFGDHIQCKNYFCNKVYSVDKDKVPIDFFSSALWQRINFLIQGVASHARSLIHDVDSNLVENFHSVVAKFVGGKRINFSKKNSYAVRVKAAAVAFNTKKTLSSLYKSLNGGKSPKGKLKRLEEIRRKKCTSNKQNKKPRRRLFPPQQMTNNKNYGEGCTKPDLDMETYEKLKTSFLANLKKTDVEIETIEKNTILQSESGEWMELRRSLLTASNFGRIIKRKDDTSCANTVKELLYKISINHVPSIKHGRDSEKTALVQLNAQLNIQIKKCGLFIDRELPFLGATPDGLCGEDAVVEIKCPITAHAIGLDEAIKQKKVTFWKRNGQDVINKNHNWYFQVQGQLRITQRSKCIFAVWSNENEPLKIEIIHRDDEFWRNKMEPKLTKFYMDCILPELIDPRQPRNLPIKDPTYVREAKETKLANKALKHNPKKVENNEKMD